MKINRANLAEHLVEYQLKQIGKTTKDAISVHDWRSYWHYGEQHLEEFKRYAIPLIKKVLKCNKKKAETTLEWFILNYGLRVYQN